MATSLNPYRRTVLAVLMAVGIAIGIADPAQAHAELVTSEPAADTVLEDSPLAIVLTFSQPVDAVDDSIRLLDDTGAVVGTGAVDQVRGDSTVAVAVDDTLEGSYVVAWQVVSEDSHPISGAFTFAVGERTDLADGLLDDAAADAGNTDAPNFFLGVGRVLAYGGLALLLGGFGVLAWCDSRLLTTPTAIRMLVGASIGAAVGVVLMIAAQTSIVGAGPLRLDAWVDVADSYAGRWWFVRLGILVGLPLLIVVARPILDQRPVQAVGAGIGAIILCVVAAGGHSTTGRATRLAFGATVLHLAAMAIWVGGLFAIVIVDRARFVTLASRFSPLALGSVVVLTTTGTFNGWRQVGPISGLLDSSYGRWLIVKVVIVGVVVVAAFFTRRSVKAARAGGAVSVIAGAAPRHSVRVELVGMIAVIVATAGLVNAPPPISNQSSSAIPITVTAVNGTKRARIDLFPAATGGSTMNVTLYSTDDEDDDIADEIAVSAELPAQGLGPIAIDTTLAGPNFATTENAVFPLPGTWNVIVTARYGTFDQVVFSQTVEIS